jgi:hypothetical protein
MKRKQIFFLFGLVFLVFSVFCLYDIISSYGEFDRNRDKIRIIEEKQHTINREKDLLHWKIERFSKDPRAAEELLRIKYKMLRPDQYKYRYTPEK